MDIRLLEGRDIDEAMQLVRDVFNEFEAPEYSRQGIDEFHSFIEPEAITAKMNHKELMLWGGYESGLLTGLIAVRARAEAGCYDHICLLFVKKEYHLRGIARRLFAEAKKACAKSGAAYITVNSSPYAQEAYRRLGFTDAGGEQTVNGIRFFPMKCVL